MIGIVRTEYIQMCHPDDAETAYMIANQIAEAISKEEVMKIMGTLFKDFSTDLIE